MTQDEENAAIGRMVARYSELKKRRAALLSEGYRIGEQLDSLGTSLKSLEYVGAFSDGRPTGRTANRPDLILRPFADATEVATLLDDLRATSAEVRELRKLMKSAGLDVE